MPEIDAQKHLASGDFLKIKWILRYFLREFVHEGMDGLLKIADFALFLPKNAQKRAILAKIGPKSRFF